MRAWGASLSGSLRRVGPGRLSVPGLLWQNPGSFRDRPAATAPPGAFTETNGEAWKSSIRSLR